MRVDSRTDRLCISSKRSRQTRDLISSYAHKCCNPVNFQRRIYRKRWSGHVNCFSFGNYFSAASRTASTCKFTHAALDYILGDVSEIEGTMPLYFRRHQHEMLAHTYTNLLLYRKETIWCWGLFLWLQLILKLPGLSSAYLSEWLRP